MNVLYVIVSRWVWLLVFVIVVLIVLMKCGWFLLCVVDRYRNMIVDSLCWFFICSSVGSCVMICFIGLLCSVLLKLSMVVIGFVLVFRWLSVGCGVDDVWFCIVVGVDCNVLVICCVYVGKIICMLLNCLLFFVDGFY